MMARRSPEGSSPSASSTLLPFGSKSRRGSVASISSRAPLDKNVLGHALDDIHTSASRSEILTTFNDFAAPPPSAGLGERPAGSSAISAGLGGLYSRFKSSVATPRDGSGSASSSRPRTSDGDSSFPQAPTKRYPPSKLSSNLGDRSVSPMAQSSAGRTGVGYPLLTESTAHHPEASQPHNSLDQQVSQSSRPSSLTEEQRGERARSQPQTKGYEPSHELEQGRRSSRQSHQGTTAPEAPAGGPDSRMSLPGSEHDEDVVHADFDLLSISDEEEEEEEFRRAEAVTNLGQNHHEAIPSRPHSRLTGNSISSVAQTQSRREFATTPLDESPSAQSPKPIPQDPPEMQPSSSSLMNEMRRKVLSRDFWMKDENAKVCFNCGDSFTTFRRKHHCRTCGQIYDAKCTVLIDGIAFGQNGRLRICKTCENIIVGDESSEYSEDDEPIPASHAKQIRFSGLPPESEQLSPPKSPSPRTPHLSSSAPRRGIDNRRKTLATSTDDVFPALARPSSSRSLKSVTSRPRSSSHRFRSSRHQHMRSLRSPHVEIPHILRGAFGSRESLLLPSHPNNATDPDLIDPDLAPFMSDENPSDGEQPGLPGKPGHAYEEQPSSGTTSLFGAIKKSRPRPTSRGFFEAGNAGRDADTMSISSNRMGHRRQLGSRTLSSGSIIGRSGLSPRVVRSENLFTSHQRTHSLPRERTRDEDDVESKLYWPTHGDEAGDDGQDSPLAELDRPSLEHVKELLRQFLRDHAIRGVQRWVDALIPVLLRCAENVDPNIHRGDDIDIRQYVKLKKAPGGRPNDTVYVPGVVFSKNIALKEMRRSIRNARILLISFPLVYARHQQNFMSLEPVIAQEREYLKNLVSRIAALGPDVVLVQRDVSGLANRYLKDANISAASNVKDSVLQAISRCAQTRIISSVDKLTMDPRYLGKCQNFEVKTIMDQTMKKSFVFVSGCQEDLGCTILLRGATNGTLAKLKWITEFMCFVVYNLKLETSLFRDQFVSQSVQTKNTDPTQRANWGDVQVKQEMEAESFTLTEHKSKEADGDEALKITNNIREGSKSSDRISSGPPRNETIALKYGKMVRELQNRILSISPAVHLAEPYLLLRCRDQEREMNQLYKAFQSVSQDTKENDATSEKSSFQLITPDAIFESAHAIPWQLQNTVKAIKRVEYERAAQSYKFLQRRWEAYIAGAIDPFNPWSHQEIVILFSIISTSTADSCEGPNLLGLDFYQEHDVDVGLEPDVPLGEYVERICHQAHSPCTASRCDHSMINHYRQYVHGNGQVNIHVDRQQSKLRGMRNTILMWSFCKICKQETPVTPMSVNSWKYSFAKYLEMIFWGRALVPRAGICPHNIHRDHTRYFGFKDLAVRVEYHPINVMEVIVPNNLISWKVEKDITTKNSEFERIEHSLNRYYSSVSTRIESIKLDNVDPEKVVECRTEISHFKQRIKDEHTFSSKKLQEKYNVSAFFEIIPLNRAVRALQEKVAAWDTSFAEFENRYFPSERDLGKLAAQQLKKMYLGRTDVSQIEESDESDEEVSQSHSVEGPAATQLHPDIPLGWESKETAPSQHPIAAHPQADLNLSTAVNDTASTSLSQVSSKVGSGSIDGSNLVETFDSAQGREQSSSESAEHENNQNSFLDEIHSVPCRPPDVKGKHDSELAEPNDFTIGKAKPASKMGRNTIENKQASSPHSLPGMAESKSKSTTEPKDRTGKAQQSSMIPVPIRDNLYHQRVGSDDQNHMKAHSTASAAKKSPLHSKIPLSVSRKGLESKVLALARHFEQMSRDFERQRLRERRQRANRMRQSRVYPTASFQPVIEFFRDANEAVKEQDPSVENLHSETQEVKGSNRRSQRAARPPSPSRQSEKSLQEVIDGSLEEPKSDGSNLLASNPASDLDEIMSDSENLTRLRESDSEKISDSQLASLSDSHSDLLDIPKHDKSSIMKMLTSFWSERSASGWAALEYPLTPSDHIFADSDIIVREDEPTSLVAFALASQDYSDKLRRFRERAKAADRPQPDEMASPDALGEDIVERTLLGDKATHMKYQFQAGTSRMQCKIFYAESFDAIRQRCGVADRYVESLSRCVKWDSKGGRTKSMFLRTLEERFIIKSLSAVETQAFLRFAPDYFDYMSKCLFHGLPSALAKMLGVYQVVIKNPATGADLNCFLQVMENVFYEGPSNRMFDLKGSMRNRKAHSTGEKNEVLLDENLLDYLSQSPVYVRNHSYSFLASSISNDTLFCSKQNVMDYSLIVGLYDGRQELMVGIIDYIRTYTWDKKVESWIKDRGKHKPTIRSPKEYRNRFRASIARYFPLAPSCWEVFGTQRIEQPTAWWDTIGLDQNAVDLTTSITDESEVEPQPE